MFLGAFANCCGQGQALALQGRAWPMPMPLRWPKEVLARGVRNFFPEEWLCDHWLPMLEDLVNREPFTLFPEWLEENGHATLVKGTCADVEFLGFWPVGCQCVFHVF